MQMKMSAYKHPIVYECKIIRKYESMYIQMQTSVIVETLNKQQKKLKRLSGDTRESRQRPLEVGF